MYKQRDREKLQLCSQNNVLLVSIPFWWDQKLDTLKNIIEIHHPSLLYQTMSKE